MSRTEMRQAGSAHAEPKVIAPSLNGLILRLLGYRVLRYALVGGTTAMIYLLVFHGLRHATVLMPIWASIIAFAVAVSFQYAAHGSFTFRSKLRDAGQAFRFATTITLGFVISALFIGWAAPRLGIDEIVATILVVLVLPLINYLVFLLWVFEKRMSGRPSSSIS